MLVLINNLCGTYKIIFADTKKRLTSIISQGMKEYGLKKVMVTEILMERVKLITKEKMEKFCKRKKYTRRNRSTNETESFNDDLDSLFQDIQFGKNPVENKFTYFLSMLFCFYV